MIQKVYFSNSQGVKLCGLIDQVGSKDLIVVMVHGFNSRKEKTNLTKISESLSANNLANFRFDLYGHGESTGKLADITVSEAVDDTLQAIKYVRSLGYQKVGLLGGSFGGFVSVVAASKVPDLLFLVLLSPVSDYSLQLKSRWTQEQLDAWKQNGFINYGNQKEFVRLNYSFVLDLSHHDLSSLAKEISVPTLIIHGDQDLDVNFIQSQQLAQLIPNSKLNIIPGANHKYSDPVHSSLMLSNILSFIMDKQPK